MKQHWNLSNVLNCWMPLYSVSAVFRESIIVQACPVYIYCLYSRFSKCIRHVYTSRICSELKRGCFADPFRAFRTAGWFDALLHMDMNNGTSVLHFQVEKSLPNSQWCRSPKFLYRCCYREQASQAIIGKKRLKPFNSFQGTFNCLIGFFITSITPNSILAGGWWYNRDSG